MKKHNDWLWTTGSIFILLSIAALWALVQIDDASLRLNFYPILASFSIFTIFIWYLTIVRSARKWAKISRTRAREIEEELRETFGFRNHLLHTRIQNADEKSISTTVFTGHRGIILFIILIVAVWLWTGFAVGAIQVRLG